MTRTVVFDIGGVVCAFHPERRLRALARHTGLAPEQINATIWESGLDRCAEMGELSPADLRRRLLAALDHRIDVVTLRAAWATAFVVDPAVSRIINDLTGPVFALTNNGSMFTECLAHELEPVRELFQRVVCSWELGATKPDPIAFARLCAEVRREPAALILVDDSRVNVEAARTVGMAALSFTSAPSLERDLGALLAGRP